MLYRFSPVTTGDDVLCYVFPTKQKATQEAIDIAKKNDKIQRLIIFGSAVTPRCGALSDLDLAIDAPDISEDMFLQMARQFYCGVNSEVDVVHYNRIKNSLLKKEIDEKGVSVYVKCK
ncbi:MAG: hypothetical protein IJ237_02740 [Oscillospiraceae bacterium]|nr:hypothetical protein [Oscillospiraceae bacterium]